MDIRPEPSKTLIIFDLDGTLVEFPREYLFDTALEVLEMISHPPVSRDLLHECFADFDFYRAVEESLRHRFADQLNTLFNTRPFPPAKPFQQSVASLRGLQSAGFTLALATARADEPHALVEKLQHTGLAEYFSCIAARSCHSHDWSDKTGQLRYICETLGFDPADGIMVGDIPSDVSNAKAVGMGITAALTSGGTRREVLERAGPDLLFERIEQVANHLLSF